MAVELLDPRKIGAGYPYLTGKSGWSYRLDYDWTLSQALEHGGHSLLDVGCGKSRLGRYIAGKLDAQYIGIDRSTGNDFATWQTNHRFDIVMWVSSLEHNDMFTMRALYERSMEHLRPGGLFLATVSAAKETDWFKPSESMNLSPDDLLMLFDETELTGDYNEIHRAYRHDGAMMAKYKIRYGHFDKHDPLFIVAGVRKVRE